MPSRHVDDPRVKVSEFLVYPTGYQEMTMGDKDAWILKVMDGHRWGWSVRRGMSDSHYAMNRRGAWILESRGHGQNKFRRYPLEEALELALSWVDRRTIRGMTAAQAERWARERSQESV